jgi:hypothetical protein
MFKKAYKLSLQSEEDIKYFYENVKGNNKIEIQLLDLKDPLDRMRPLLNDIVTVHAPLYPSEDMMCNISSVGKGLHERGDYHAYLYKVAKFLRRANCGLVIHSDISPEELENAYYYHDILDYIVQNQIWIHLENVTSREVPNQMNALMYPVLLSKKINTALGKTLAFPLLDICHYQMLRNDFNSNISLSLQDTIDLYRSGKFVIHFNNAEGSGDEKTGGIHGYNFSNDLRTLNQLLDYLRPINRTLILETGEVDLKKKERAVWLNNYIEKYEKEGD